MAALRTRLRFHEQAKKEEQGPQDGGDYSEFAKEYIAVPSMVAMGTNLELETGSVQSDSVGQQDHIKGARIKYRLFDIGNFWRNT